MKNILVSFGIVLLFVLGGIPNIVFANQTTNISYDEFKFSYEKPQQPMAYNEKKVNYPELNDSNGKFELGTVYPKTGEKQTPLFSWVGFLIIGLLLLICWERRLKDEKR